MNKQVNRIDLSKSQLVQIAAFTKKLSNDKSFIQKYFHNTGFIPRLHQFWSLYQTIIQPPGNILRVIPFELNERIPNKDKQTKVQKGTEWRSDVRAIRDAYSHIHYIIQKSNGDYEVTFDNNEGGYNYQKTFSRREFILFYQDYDRLLAIQNTLFRTGLIYKLVDLQKQLDVLRMT